jgi:hypothetical protein
MTIEQAGACRAMLAAVDAAQLELPNGRPEAYKALWSAQESGDLA